MDTRNNKRKRVETENVEEYLKKNGVFNEIDKILKNMSGNQFKQLMKIIVVNDEQKKVINVIKNKLKNNEYSEKYQIKKNNELEECKNKITKLETENKLYRQKILDLEKTPYKEKILELENKNKLLENRITYLMEQPDDIDLIDFNDLIAV